MNRSPLLLSAIALAFAQFALADDPPTSNQSVQQRIDALQKELDKLKEEQQKSKLTTQDQPRVTFNANRPTITSSDGSSSLSMRVLVQADVAHYDQDSAGPLSTDFRRGSIGGAGNRETNAARDLSDGAYFRRARFGVEGAIARNFNYRLIMELGGAGTEGPTRINDAWINYTGLAPFTIQLGAYSPPANLEDGNSPDDSLFIERASSSELSRALGGADGRLGLGIRGSGARWMSALTFTGRTVNDAEVFDSQTAIVGRAAMLVATGSNYNVHAGLNATYVLHAPDNGLDASGIRYGIRFRDRPELRVDSTRLIDTGVIDADHAHAVGVEFATNWRTLYFQAEDFWFGIDRSPATSALSNPSFNGYYAQGGWILTGESRRYNMPTASYQNPHPFQPLAKNGGWGAWELALRYSRMDLNDDEGVAGAVTPTSGIRGGDQKIWTFGVDWYVNTNVKFLLNVLHVDVDRLNPAAPGNATPFGAAPATPPNGVQIGQKYNAFALRSQFNF